MVISIKYNNINIRMSNNSSTHGDIVSDVDTQEALRKFLYQIVRQYKMKSTRTFYLANLYIYNSDNPKPHANHIIQHQFNEVIQLFIDIKEKHRICDDNINSINLDAGFQDSNDRVTAKLIAKLIKIYSTSKSIKMCLHISISILEMQEPLADKDMSIRYDNDCLIITLHAREQTKQNIILPLNSEDVKSSSESSKCNDALDSDELELAKYLEVDGVMEELVNTICFTPPWHNDDNCNVM